MLSSDDELEYADDERYLAHVALSFRSKSQEEDPNAIYGQFKHSYHGYRERIIACLNYSKVFFTATTRKHILQHYINPPKLFQSDKSHVHPQLQCLHQWFNNTQENCAQRLIDMLTNNHKDIDVAHGYTLVVK